MFLYYEEGAPTEVVSPDLFVAFDVDPHQRRSWFTWKEGKAPEVVFEFTSRGTKMADQVHKKALYEWLGVTEYFLFDPLDEYLRPRLQGFRLQAGHYSAIPTEDGSLISQSLGLRLQANGNFLDLFEIETGRRLLPPEKLEEAFYESQTALQKVEAEIKRLK